MLSESISESRFGYTLRLNFPDSDLESVAISWRAISAHRRARRRHAWVRYEDTVALTGVAPDAKLTVERTQKDGLIVVTVLLRGSQPSGRVAV